MGLFSPWFLAGLVAVGLPIWLHLLKRASTEPKPFPSLMFFEHREATTVHKRLDFILLFILRTLMLVLLALLFANPFIRTSTPIGRGERLVVVAVDRSFSMRTSEGAGGSRLEQAKNEALSVIGSIPPNTKAQVVALAGTLQAMTQQVTDLGELRVAVAAIEPSDSRASFGELARYLRTLRESADMPIEAHLISDMQKSAMPPGFTDLRLEGDTTLKLHPVGSVQPNWAVETVNAPPRLYDPAQSKIAVTVAGFNAPKATRTVTLLLNGKAVGTKSVEVAENGRGTVEFVGLEASQGFNKCEVRIDGADSLPADDRFTFAVERADPKKVLFIDDGRRPNAEKFFRAALESAKDGEYSMELQRGVVAANATLAKYSVVVLSDLTNVPEQLEKSLVDFVNKGGGLFAALGAGSAQLRTAPVLDEAIQGTSYAGREGERFWSVADIDTGHPALANVERMDGVKFFQVARVTATKSQVLARLSDGSPLVLQRRVGEGNVLAFTSSLDQSSNDFPLKPSYVPFVQQAVRYLGGGGAAQPVNLSVDSYVELRAGDGEKGVMAEVLDPAGQRALSVEEATNAPNYALRQEGFYDVKTAAGRRTLVAAHADRRESDLTPMDQEMRDLWSATGESAQPAAGAGQTGTLDGSTTPRSLSLYILVLLLGVALAESVIANRYLRSPAQYEGG
jgi:hypothetical protein